MMGRTYRGAIQEKAIWLCPVLAPSYSEAKEQGRIVMNACAACPDKGHCCREFYISKDGKGILSDSQESAATYVSEVLEFPFKPLYQTDQFEWVFECEWLREDGRCGDYEHRPELCRLYKAGSSLLCLMSRQLVAKIEAD